MPDDEPVTEKKEKKEGKLPGSSVEDRIAFMRLEMQYGANEVEEVLHVVREEMKLSPADTDVEVARRLREKHEREEKKTAEEIVEKAKEDREKVIHEKEVEANEEIKRREEKRQEEKKENEAK